MKAQFYSDAKKEGDDWPEKAKDTLIDRYIN